MPCTGGREARNIARVLPDVPLAYLVDLKGTHSLLGICGRELALGLLPRLAPAYSFPMAHEDDAFLNSPFIPRTFFVPGTKNPGAAEEIYMGTSKNLHGETVPSRRIQRLDYVHDGRTYRAEVGQQDQGGEGLVLAIFGPSSPRNVYYVTTYNRGVARGEPIMVGGGAVLGVYEFLTEEAE